MAITRLLQGDRGGMVLLILLLIVSVVVPLLNLAVPEGNPLHLV